MRVLILISSFPPEIRSASHLFYELAQSFVKDGHQVTVITKIPLYNIAQSQPLDPKYKGKLSMSENMDNIRVLRLASIPFPRNIPLARIFDEFYLALVFFLRGLFIKKQDVVLVYSPPLPLGLAACLLKFFKGTPLVLNVQDLYPQAAIDLGLLKNKFAISLARSLEKMIYRRASLITVHSQGNLEHVSRQGIVVSKIRIIPNWVDTDLVTPGNKNNQFRATHGLNNAFLVSFAGVIGYAQDLEAVIESAKILSSHQDIKFLIVGEGVAKSALQQKAKDLNLSNVEFLPMQAKETYNQILQASDVCLVTLKKEVKTPVIPGKTMSIMAAGRPIIASLPLAGDAAALIKVSGAGIVVDAGDPQALGQAILELYQNKEKREAMGNNGRHYAQKNLSRNACVKRYEELFLLLQGNKK